MRSIVVGVVVAAIVVVAGIGMTERGVSASVSEAAATPEALEAEEPLQGASCGDGQCQPPEDCHSCPQDCGNCCGNNRCEPPEDCRSCPQDCGNCS